MLDVQSIRETGDLLEEVRERRIESSRCLAPFPEKLYTGFGELSIVDIEELRPVLLQRSIPSPQNPAIPPQDIDEKGVVQAERLIKEEPLPIR
jgi:hypothetical protein